MVQYRYRTATIFGRWRPTRAKAREDAVRVRLAEPVRRKPASLLWLVPGEIEADGE